MSTQDFAVTPEEPPLSLLARTSLLASLYLPVYGFVHLYDL